jgi:D-alanyl-D-alanine carboxypeptidase/D-alanyl-D-alanine-endopeptidase (penicillin-binding protein 4)
MRRRRRWRALAFLIALAATARAADPPLQALARHVGAGQGVFVDAADGTILVSQAADLPVHPASVTKVATSLALLDRLGPEHRFETRFVTTGALANGRLDGDLVAVGGDDPFFVFESAFLVLQRLRTLGLARVGGRVAARGEFLFNWQPDPDGTRLAKALAGRDGAAAWTAVGDGTPLTRAGLAIERGRAGSAGGAERTLVTHRSPPLVHVLKICDGYSNNVLHFASNAIGGPHVVESIARSVVPEALRSEITIDNGAGAGKTNRLSPRAAAAILRVLDTRMTALHGTITDVLPVSGVDPGTLKERLLDHRRFVVGKTGTFGSEGASGLVGLLRSQRYGTVAFAVLDHGVPVPEARKRQDAFVRALIDAVDAEPWPYDTPARSTYTLALVE